MGSLAVLLASTVLFVHTPAKLTVTAPGYRLVLAAATGRILEIDDARGHKLLGETNGCLWLLNPNHHATSVSGCSIRPRVRWRAPLLTLTYGTRATVAIRAAARSFDLRLTVPKNTGAVRDEIRFPAGLAGDARTVQAGYSPNVLPGVQLAPAFFSRVGSGVQVYPSRWAFADYAALDQNGGHVALYAVNTGPLAPVAVGFFHDASGACGGTEYCLLHQFQTWVEPGATWRSPIVRVRVGETAQQTILDYRRDNGIAAYPSLAQKLGERLATLARAPLLKADAAKLGLPFAQWGPLLQRLPSPVVLHPVGYEPGGHDANDPDFLPPDPSLGTTADLASLIGTAHALGDLVMPYDNLSWWDPSSPTLATTSRTQVGVLNAEGEVETVDYGAHSGVIVSPSAPLVRRRSLQELDTWRSLGADCVFLDQLGARPWLRDFNPSATSPLGYDDQWLSLIAPLRDRCLMVEDGWDRLARDAVGFHGGLLMMQRELGAVDRFFGAGNWQPYPLATWLVHDKVLMYQHDLYDATMAADSEVLTWNAAFGLVESYQWARGDEANAWLELAARVQQALGPHEAGVPLDSFSQLAPGVTRSVFGDLAVEANLSDASYDGIPADGFRATVRDGSVRVQAYPGGHWLVVDHGVVRQPVGDDLDVTVPGASVLGPDGQPVPSTRSGADVTFTYRAGVPFYTVR